MAKPAWLFLASFYLDSGTERVSGGNVRHPDYLYEGRVKSWGFIEKTIPIVAGRPHVSDARIRVGDKDRKWRDILADTETTTRRRLVDIRAVLEGTSEAAAYVVYTGEIQDAERHEEQVEFSLRDHMFSWLDEEVPAMVNATLYPGLDPKNDGQFLPIIQGLVNSFPERPEGQVRCPHFGLMEFEGVIYDVYGLAAHPVFDFGLYRRVSYLGEEGETDHAKEWEPVDPREYTSIVVPITGYGVDMNHTLILFTLDQADAEIRADCEGIDFRGAWGTLPPSGFHATENPGGTPGVQRNPIDFFIGMIFFIMHKAGRTQEDVWDTEEIAALREHFEDLVYVSDGAMTRVTKAGDFLAQFLSSFNLDMFQKRNGLITLGFTEEASPADYIHFIEGVHILKGSWKERLPDDISTQEIFQYFRIPVEDRFYLSGIADTVEQAILGFETPSGTEPIAETGRFDLYWVRQLEVANDVILRRLPYLSLKSFRQEFEVPLPLVLTQDVELGDLIQITHSAGLASPNGYSAQLVKIIGMVFDLGRMVCRLTTVRRVTPQLMDTSPA